MHRRYIQTSLRLIVFLAILAALFVLPRFLSHVQRDQSQTLHAVGTRFPITLTDVTGRTVTIPEPPKRIISLAPGITEILFAIGAGDRVIADTTFCDYPSAAAKLPKIGGYLDPNIEKISAMKADLIIAERGTQKGVLDHLAELGLPLLVVDPTRMEEVCETIHLLGAVTGTNTQAETLRRNFINRQRNVEKIIRAIPDEKRPRTLFLFSLDDGIYTAGPGSHIDELITMSGGQNLAKPTGKPWPQLSMEMVTNADPEVIVLPATHGYGKTLTVQAAVKQLRAKPQWVEISAVKTGRVVILDDDLITLPGPRSIDGLEQLAVALHPDRFAGKARK